MPSVVSARPLRRAAVVLAAMAMTAAGLSPGIAAADPPANDDFDNATVISAVPFRSVTSTVDATSAPDDPISCSNNGSVWFQFTPATSGLVSVDTFGSSYDTVLSAYTGSRGSLSQVPGACNDDTEGTQSRIVFSGTAGTTYHFLVAFCCGTGQSGGGGNLTLSASLATPPANDNFANAQVVAALPVNLSPELAAASVEPGEPASNCGSVTRSVWYSFTPTEDRSVTAQETTFQFSVVSIYTGTAITNLTELGCSTFQPVTVRMTAGQTYFVRVGAFNSGVSTVRVNLATAPPVTTQFVVSPANPSSFTTITFIDQSFDPGGAGIVRRDWQFGDGTTGTGFSPTHRYATDGDYEVRLDVATTDGRTGTATQTVAVRTHDVGISAFDVPTSGRVGQTKPLVVKVRNSRYDETVTVTLYRGTPNGFVEIGSLTQFVPARTTGRAAEFPFNYTFTSDDATIGKVTFRAVATIQNATDALPSDNEIIATPTKVTT